ncbi:MAG TPA: hypothetical protein VFU69_15240 [Ktedonobacterales bacterium]|nr:hypothetical protein [Ktedonobacterales bacterium]
MLNSHLPQPTPGPDCLFFADLLPLLGEETLPGPEASEARAHLAACVYCQQEYAAYQRIDANLRRHFDALPSLRFEPEDIMMLPDGSTPSEPAPDTAPAPVQITPPRRTRRVVSLFSVVAAVLVIVVVVTAIVVSRGPSQSSQTTHPGVGSPTPTLGPAPTETAYVPDKNDEFFVMQMLSPTEGWFAGANDVVTNDPNQPVLSTPLIVHYHDGHWLRVAVPSSEQLGVSNPQLYSISMVSPDEGWIVGSGDSQGQVSAFILRYSGGWWTRYGSPMRNARLWQVQMLSPTDGWMVGGGNLDMAGAQTSLMLHYDGRRWTPVPMPPAHIITQVDMVSATDGWAVGQGTVLHYDGQRWTIFQMIPQIREISMGSATDGWAVSSGPADEQGDILWHYNGNQWVQSVDFTSSNPADAMGVGSLSMDSATDGWAVGFEASSTGTARESFLHYTQGRWTKVPVPRGVFVYGLTMISSDEGWATGSDTSGGGKLILLRYQQGSWRIYQS